MTKSAPAFIPSSKGTKSTFLRAAILLSIFTLSIWVSPFEEPCPGKCFSVAETFVDCIPFTNALTIDATFSGSEPNDLEPISKFKSLVLTSATGAKSTLNPSFFMSFPIVSPIFLTYSVFCLLPTSSIDGKLVVFISGFPAILATSPPSSSTVTKRGTGALF